MQKKIRFMAATVLLTYGLHAQIQKGGIYPGFSGGAGISRYNNSFIQPSLEVGISGSLTAGLFYYSTHYDNPYFNLGDYTSKKGGGLTFTQYRYFNRKTKWGWYINATAGIYQIRAIQKQAGTMILNNRYSQGELTVSPGLFFTPSPRIMFFASLGGFSMSHNKNEAVRLGNQFLDHIQVGVRFTLGGRHKKKSGPLP